MPVKWPYIIVLIILIMALFRIFYSRIEDYFVFFPDADLEFSPVQYRLEYKDVYFDSHKDYLLHGWLFPGSGSFPVILFCHGNAGNISHRLENITMLLERELGVFIFDYSGYGKSHGKPSESQIYSDGLSAYDYLVNRENIRPENIVLFGRSLGAAVAIEVATKRKAGSIIIESGFTSTRDMAKTMFPFSLLSCLIPPNYNNIKKIPRIEIPKLIIHGKKDDVVPFTMGERLFNASRAPRYFLPLENAGHNDTYVEGGERYFQTIISFVKDSKV